MFDGLTKAKEGFVAGAGKAIETGSQVYSTVGEQTKKGLDWTADSMKVGATAIYEVGGQGANKILEIGNSGASVAKDKLDEVGVTDGAKAAGSAVVGGA